MNRIVENHVPVRRRDTRASMHAWPRHNPTPRLEDSLHRLSGYLAINRTNKKPSAKTPINDEQKRQPECTSTATDFCSRKLYVEDDANEYYCRHCAVS